MKSHELTPGGASPKPAAPAAAAAAADLLLTVRVCHCNTALRTCPPRDEDPAAAACPALPCPGRGS